jgi:pimeloyl-ACP methyl ester carboxylesterase
MEIQGSGPNILLPVNPQAIEGTQAEEMKKWGMNPALGQHLITGLSDRYRVIAFDYEGHVQQNPKADTLTPDNITKDFLAVADAAGADTFAYYGYSWLALSGLQLAIRSKRLSALIMGGFPPVNGPYQEMLKVTMTTYEMAVAPKKETEIQQSFSDTVNWDTVEVTLSEAQTKQFVTLYQALKTFDDKQIQTQISCPKLCFAGGADKIKYGERWGDVEVDIIGPLLEQRNDLKVLGWDVQVLEGLDHTQAMQPDVVLQAIGPWLDKHLSPH